MLGYIVRGGQYSLGYIVRGTLYPRLYCRGGGGGGGDNIRGDNIYYDTVKAIKIYLKTLHTNYAW